MTLVMQPTKPLTDISNFKANQIYRGFSQYFENMAHIHEIGNFRSDMLKNEEKMHDCNFAHKQSLPMMATSII